VTPVEGRRSGVGGGNFEDEKSGRIGGLGQAAIGANKVPSGGLLMAPDQRSGELQGVGGSQGIFIE